jgi:hypothetical protein
MSLSKRRRERASPFTFDRRRRNSCWAARSEEGDEEGDEEEEEEEEEEVGRSISSSEGG